MYALDRTKLYFILLFVPSIIFNVIELATNFGLPSVGPSGVQYSQIGIITGFSLVNGFPLFRAGGVMANFRRSVLASLISIVNLGLGVFIILIAVFNPIQFFSVVGFVGLKVNYYTHVFAFITTVLRLSFGV
jgi:hypothetical protein